MTLTGTFVLAFPRDPMAALARAAQIGTAALGLLFRYLTRPPVPGVGRTELAEAYGLTPGALRRDNAELAEAGFLLQARRPVGKGGWQHLIVVHEEPGQLPAERDAWALLDAALAAERANTSPESAHVATCDDAPEPQVATCDQKRHIEPVNPLSSVSSEHNPSPSIVGTVAELRSLSQLPPIPAPEEQGDLWLTPAQVLTLATKYPPRYADVALSLLSRQLLPFYLAPRVMALMIQGYDTGQLARTLTGVHEGEHPVAIARWRLDQLLLTPEPKQHVEWRAPSTTISASPASAELMASAARGASAARANLRARGLRT